MRFRASLVSLSLIGALVLAPNSWATGIEDLKCAKVNEIKKVSTVTYKCQGIGKKLMWKRVVMPAGAAPQKAPASSSSQPPAIDPILASVNQAMNAILPKVSLSDADPKLIGTYVIDPAVPPDLAKQYAASADLILRKVAVAQPLLQLKNPPVLLISASTAWLADQADAKFPTCFDTKWIRSQSAPYTWASLSCYSTTPVQILPIDPPDPTKIVTGFGSDLGYGPIGYFSGEHNDLPAWFVRGLKTVVAEYIDSLGSSTWKPQTWMMRDCKNVTLADLSMTASQTGTFNGRVCAPAVGVNVMRYWVAKYGFEKTLAFSVEAHKTGIFEPAKFLGMPLSEFEAQAYDYMKRTPDWSAS
jgi:hypothetical protein